MVSKTKSELTVFVPDLHPPFHDEKAVSTAIEFVRYLKPAHLIFLGDVFDFYQLSRFDKNPKRVVRLEEDITLGKEVLKAFCDAAPTAKKKMVEGNHERRLYKYLCSHPEMSSLDALRPEKLLGLEEMGIEWYPEETVLEHHGLVVTHGTRVSKHAGMSAKGELEKWGCSGISGHTHRMNPFHMSNYGGDYVWYEGGCLCDLNPTYVVGRPNWQHGISIGDFIPGTGRFTVHQLYIDRHYRILHHGKLFDGLAA